MSPERESTRENASLNQPGLITRISSYFIRHLQVFFYSLGQVSRTPFSTLMTCMVIGIAMALPSGLYVMLKNVEQLSGGWESTAQISVFLKKNINNSQARNLQRDIEAWPEVISVLFISREEALEEFKQRSGFGDALTALNSNPLPSVLVIKPRIDKATTSTSQELLEKLKLMKQTDRAQLDMQWIRRLYAMMSIVERGVEILGIMFSLAVLLVVGNTIRLAIQNRKQEIIVIKLIGGTDSFIRRPFLYTGFWYGLFGGMISWLMVTFSILAISDPVESLTLLYQNQFSLANISFQSTLALVGISILLGLAGSWLAVGRHLKDIEPR